MQLSFTRLGFCGTVATLKFSTPEGYEPSRIRRFSEAAGGGLCQTKSQQQPECCFRPPHWHNRRSVAEFQGKEGL